MNIPIRGFIHCTFLNDYLDIMKKILDTMMDSGFIEASDSVSIGALGDESRLQSLKDLVALYPKNVQIRGWNPNKNLWEGFSQQWMKQDADTLPKFIGLYCHTKGATFGSESEGVRALPDRKKTSEFWFHYMLHEVVGRWKVGYDLLTMPETGYDLYGARATPQRESGSLYSHYSGNYVMFNSEYVKTLPRITDDESLPNVEEEIHSLVAKIKNLCRDGRVPMEGAMFTPEMIWGFAQPIMAIACNAWMVGFPTPKTYDEVISEGFSIEKYRTIK